MKQEKSFKESFGKLLCKDRKYAKNNQKMYLKRYQTKN